MSISRFEQMNGQIKSRDFEEFCKDICVSWARYSFGEFFKAFKVRISTLDDSTSIAVTLEITQILLNTYKC